MTKAQMAVQLPVSLKSRTQYQSRTEHLLRDTPLLHCRRTVLRHGEANWRSIILPVPCEQGHDKGMPQTWEVTWPCRKQHVGWLTNRANGVLVMQHTDCSRVCSLSNVTLFHGTHLSTRNFKTSTNGQQQHCAQRSHCHRQWKLAVPWVGERQACHSFVHHGFHWTVLEKNKSVLKILYRSSSTSKLTKKKLRK